MKYISKITSALCVAILLASFTLHSVQVKHTHHAESHAEATTYTHVHADGSSDTHTASEQSNKNEDSESLNDVMHMAEKKLLLFIMSATLLFVAFTHPQWLSYQRLRIFAYSRTRRFIASFIPILHSYIRRLYTAGILNPKLY